ncbi:MULTISPECIES: type 2 isopentenyl-diphosphate Delta-isomerase [Aerococcus]|uniref:type 2 isopentenyl-diphosphate Delta-isomerase n=1 Tax=Aerococcus TaxID=1375 RepID=UPI000DCB965B|nr:MULTISPECIES: type 2 isopentenyl-diphosphate Delta-isomerase [Aerococcus]KAA9234404.1 type 2 isopentenyl-diphosphate Delta-isomerase [Aerococcus mictus]MBU5610258.1 type 2 isopentenyl-diphosphate Delta-isomerase [Aerococcus urinae]MDK6291468.1 type 2 isopentenyl-diphosphate Delta-isomerase [Aerococcus urinae]MDK6374507.1 type 2 isopentenyl-diphosphate Delta-isomerase [Aerococcus urinae]MDK6420254.1 type 2 isopentenyl-diphosphate Delta-isomerase [Aerococcus urinae]
MKNRKDDHIKLADWQYAQSATDFDAIRFVHHSLPHIDADQVQLNTQLFGQEFPFPFFINAMTGGSEWTKAINEKFATVARETGLMMATGSVSQAIKDPDTADSFQIVRQSNPKGFIIANIGMNHGLAGAKQALEITDADALAIHLNTPQELAMPEGDRHFQAVKDNIQAIVEGIDRPVMVKEVGFGMSRETIEELLSLGVKTVDVSGQGGTNFIAIENERRSLKDMDYLTQWGQSTAISLLEAQSLKEQVDVIASGGVKTPLHVALSLALGAKAVGMSGQFLHLILNHGVQETIDWVEEFKDQVRMLMVLNNSQTLSDLEKTDLIISGPVRDWCLARQIPYQDFSHRSR